MFDLSDNGHDFIEAHVKLKTLAYFYLTQFPQILVICLPVGLLLALLYSLSRMSRSNEIISMLTAGQSVAARDAARSSSSGFFTALFSLALNYQLAPHSDQMRKILHGPDHQRQRPHRRDRAATLPQPPGRPHLARRVDPEKAEHCSGASISASRTPMATSSPNGTPTAAVFNPDDKSWTFTRGKQVNFDKAGQHPQRGRLAGCAARSGSPAGRRPSGASSAPTTTRRTSRCRNSRSTSPITATSPRRRLAPFRTHFWYRWAVPFQCLVVIFIAAPLGIVYSRRGVLAGVASCIFIFSAMGFIEKLFLALGKGDRIPAIVAAWTSDVVFTLVGCYLLYLRVE